MDSALEYHTAYAMLDWQIDLGVTETICDAPINRFELQEKSKAKAGARAPIAPAPVPQKKPEIDPVAVAEKSANAAKTLDELQSAIAAFEHCDLKRGARKLVFCDGNPAARVMIIGEAPGRDEDREGKPFVGRAGHLLDKMFAAIDMGRAAPASEDGLYITNVMPWRPPQNRDPQPHEIQMMLPFLRRHVELIAPEVIVLMGNISCQAVLGKKGITRLRGQWQEAFAKPVLPMFHPAYLLRSPQAKRHAWADLLALRAKLKES